MSQETSEPPFRSPRYLLTCLTVSRRRHQYILSDGHHHQRLELLCNLLNAPPQPPPPTSKSYPHHPSIFILLLPQIIDFLFSLFSLPLSPTSLHLLERTPNSSACLSVLRFALCRSLSLSLSFSPWSEFLLFDKVKAPAVLGAA